MAGMVSAEGVGQTWGGDEISTKKYRWDFSEVFARLVPKDKHLDAQSASDFKSNLLAIQIAAG